MEHFTRYITRIMCFERDGKGLGFFFIRENFIIMFKVSGDTVSFLIIICAVCNQLQTSLKIQSKDILVEFLTCRWRVRQ